MQGFLLTNRSTRVFAGKKVKPKCYHPKELKGLCPHNHASTVLVDIMSPLHKEDARLVLIFYSVIQVYITEDFN